jgi:hypothetical protein
MTMRELPRDPELTLRDYFAGQALPQAIAREIAVRDTFIKPPNFNYEDVAIASYLMADAMLKERAK